MAVRGEGAQLIQFAVAIGLVVFTASAFLISMPIGLLAGFCLTFALCLASPANIPATIIISFMFQNTIIAVFVPLIPDDATFTAIRGVNFVILITTYGAFQLATFLTPNVLTPASRKLYNYAQWVLAAVLFYLALGILRGAPGDALIYFRNTIAPIACFQICLVAASRYQIDLGDAVKWVVVLCVAYGYCELFFTFDFLSLFNGDQYVERQMNKQIQAGHWEAVLKETGFVLRNLDDVMTTNFFNTKLFSDIFPRVFRLSGPNFHTISFAYSLSIISAWLLFNSRWIIPLFAAPLLIIIGSKGAMILFVMALGTRGCMLLIRKGTLLMWFFVATGAWLMIAVILGRIGDDYHYLGFVAGLSEFAANPLGQGLGIGGNLSSSTVGKLNWGEAQATGATGIPVESAVGVMLYQMGIGSFVFFGFLFSLVVKCRRLFLTTHDPRFLFCVVTITTLSFNAVLQEEAFYSPLALGLCLSLVACQLAEAYRV